MHLLIDGHNLIGQIATIDLRDPDDEAKLVLLLRSYAVQRRNRQVVVVFDHGTYGHPQHLDGYGVTCHFARSPRDADTHLIHRITTMARPREWTLVSSDRAIVQVARDRGMRVIDSRQFAQQLQTNTRARVRSKSSDSGGEKQDRSLSKHEIEEWLRLFGEEPQP